MFRPGDRVRFKPFEEAICAPGFVSGMEYLCGTEATVASVGGIVVELRDFESNKWTGYIYTTQMFEMVEPEEDNSYSFNETEFLQMIT